MRKITTYQLLKAAKRNIILILTPAILVFALVLSQTILKMSKTYQADAMLMITGVQKGDPVGYNNIILNEKRNFQVGLRMWILRKTWKVMLIPKLEL